ncbi:metallophosphoesterase family protein [Natrialba swarupiae]|uniref:Phosphoesterase n=1 Tax=Natrialba swarupiae TaxID=2448032 RepID=A0A5D5ALT9_9EURY|nr:metallophosphoesterase family protein [Natrialba swarupiae]MCW8172115.1 YfcE family phosphodiesterase [Natrialba swarupiae]TYT62686.1 YfcE family phosphodiesterase [Natrialba swarupiae]
MTQVAILGDTHVPSRATGLPDWVAEEVRTAGRTIHTGDFDSREAYDRIATLADGNLTCVRGNMDPSTLELPRTDTLVLEDVTVVVTHGTGSPGGWHRRVVEIAYDEVDTGENAVVVAGHTHEVVDTARDGIRVLNPGSATAASPATHETMLVAHIEDGHVTVDTLTR